MTPGKAQSFLRSSLGLKIVMALTGLILFGFVIGHMIGNLQVYLGPEVFNHYAETLRELGFVGQLNGATVLINYVTHPAMVQDSTSTLERTRWLVF